MDFWHDDTYPIKIWSSFVQPNWIYLTVHKPRMSVGQESCRARTSYVPRVLQQHAYTSGHKQMQGPHHSKVSFCLTFIRFMTVCPASIQRNLYYV